MELDEVVHDIREMYKYGPEVETVRSLYQHFKDGGEGIDDDMPTLDQIERAVSLLVQDAVLQRAGRDGYEATEDFMAKSEEEGYQ